MERFLVRWKQKRNPPRRFSIHPILVDETLRFTSSKFGGFRKNPRIDRFLAKCYMTRGCQKLSKSTKYLPKTSFGTYNPNVRKCQDPFNYPPIVFGIVTFFFEQLFSPLFFPESYFLLKKVTFLLAEPAGGVF